MLGLLYREYILNKKSLVHIIFLIYLFLGFSMTDNLTSITLQLLLVYAYYASVERMDAQYNANLFACALPVSRSQIAFARYLSITLYVTLAVCLSGLFVYIKESDYTLARVLVTCTVTLWVSYLILPLYFLTTQHIDFTKARFVLLIIGVIGFTLVNSINGLITMFLTSHTSFPQLIPLLLLSIALIWYIGNRLCVMIINKQDF